MIKPFFLFLQHAYHSTSHTLTHRRQRVQSMTMDHEFLCSFTIMLDTNS